MNLLEKIDRPNLSTIRIKLWENEIAWASYEHNKLEG